LAVAEEDHDERKDQQANEQQSAERPQRVQPAQAPPRQAENDQAKQRKGDTEALRPLIRRADPSLGFRHALAGGLSRPREGRPRHFCSLPPGNSLSFLMSTFFKLRVCMSFSRNLPRSLRSSGLKVSFFGMACVWQY